MKTIKLSIKDVQFTNDGDIAIITDTHAINATGVFVMKGNQAGRILMRAGVPNALALKHLVTLTNGTSKLTVQVEECKAGDAWTNEKTGETGTYEKDWTKLSNHSVELGFAAQMKLVDASLAGMSAGFAPVQRVAAPAPVAAVESTENDNVPNV